MFSKLKNMFSRIATAIWGKFESREEIYKFLNLATIFAFIIGILWALHPLKDSIFGATVGIEHQPWARILSVSVIFPLVILYTKLVDRFQRDKIFYILITGYALVGLIFMAILSTNTYGLGNLTVSPWRIIGWLWYVYVESYGSLIIALFWVIVTDITLPDSAKRGFPLIFLFGQLGNFAGPYFFRAQRFGFSTSVPIIGFCSGLMVFTGFLLWRFFRKTPEGQILGYTGKRMLDKKEPKVTFFQGLQHIFKHGYLLGILFIVTVYEFIVVIFDYQFKVMAKAAYPQEAVNAAYLADFGIYTGVAATLCVLFGTKNIQRKFGMFGSLFIVPLLVLAAILTFKFKPDLSVLFWIMVFAKAVTYALNNPIVKQLYIPLSKEARYKSQGWIQMFGGRFTKSIASMVNLSRGLFITQYGAIAGIQLFLILSSSLSIALVFVWFFVAFYLAKKHRKAISEKSVVC